MSCLPFHCMLCMGVHVTCQLTKYACALCPRVVFRSSTHTKQICWTFRGENVTPGAAHSSLHLFCVECFSCATNGSDTLIQQGNGVHVALNRSRVQYLVLLACLRYPDCHRTGLRHLCRIHVHEESPQCTCDWSCAGTRCKREQLE
jgi:hypothetical protein